MKVRAEIDISAPRERIWAAICDIHNCHNMISAIIRVKVLESPPSGMVGLKWEETRMIFGKEATETMWVTHSQDNQLYQTRAENHGTVYISRMELAERNGVSTLSMSFADQPASLFAKLMSRIMGVFGKGMMQKMLQRDLEDIKAFVESN